MTPTKELRELLERATSLPWSTGPAHVVRYQWRDDQRRRITEWVAECVGQHPPGEIEANAVLIVVAVNALPALLDRVEEMEATIARIRAALEYAPPLSADEIDSLIAVEAGSLRQVARKYGLGVGQVRGARKRINARAALGEG